MTWRRALADWKDLDQRRPAAWWLGLSGTLAGALALAVLEVLRIAPQGPARWILLAGLLTAVVAVGRRVVWNDAERRLRLPWRVAGFVLLVILLNAAASAAGLHFHPSELERGSGAALVLTVTALAMLTVSALVAVRVFDRRPVRELGIVPGPGFWGDLAFGLGLGAVLMTLIFAVEWRAGWVRIDAAGHTRAPGETFAGAFLRMAGVFACVGFYEELVDRGYLLRTMAQGFAGRRVRAGHALAIAVVVSSLLFGLGHAGNPNASFVSTVNIALAGMVLALPYVLTGRLAVSIGLHATWNFFQSTVYGFPTSGFTSPASALLIEQSGPAEWTGGAFGPEAGLLGLLALVLAAAAILWRERRRSGRVAVCTALVEGTPPAQASDDRIPFSVSDGTGFVR
jgi:membrane protease YdiL (CAAX protease family)